MRRLGAKHLIVFFLLASIAPAGCASSRIVGGEDDGYQGEGHENDDKTDADGEDTSSDESLRVEITSPSRGLIAEGERLDVGGYVEATAGVDDVTLNGKEVEVDADGAFSAELELAESINLLETVATDRAGNEKVDARAVLAGELVPQHTPAAEGLATHLGSNAMGGLSQVVSDYAEATNWSGLARSQNPVAGAGSGCNHYEANITDLSHGGVEVEAQPAAGGVDVDVFVRDFRVEGDVEWEAVCVGGGTSFVITADTYAMGARVEPALAGRNPTVHLREVSSQFFGFNVSVSGLPGFVEDTFRSQVRDYLAGMARDWIRDEVPGVSREFLGDFADTALSLEILGQEIRVEVSPTEMSWRETGGTITLESSAYAPGHEDGAYLATPSPQPEPGRLADTDFEVMVAEDAVNQIFAAIWHSGALDDALLPEEASAVGALIGEPIDRVAATMLLPPVAQFDGEREIAQLTVGDLLIEAYDSSGDRVVRFALSAEIEVAADESEDGELELATGPSRVLAHVLTKGPGVSVDEDALADVAELVIGEVGGHAEELLDAIPVPGLPSAVIADPSAEPRDGYLSAGGRISFD